MKYIMVSRFFPKSHPRAGESTHFVEKIEACLADTIPGWEMSKTFTLHEWEPYYNCTMPKHHTIRSGTRYCPGETISLRVWSGLPYRSKQIAFAQVEVKKVWPFRIFTVGTKLIWQLTGCGSGEFNTTSNSLKLIARNDGLELEDFISWFEKHPKKMEQRFGGQLITWSDKIDYV